ncbi:transposase [Pedobacter petrophilus]|uniref:Transposase n=1 Tax=Pedobacter petrophilus TaxID=1908241 RepID=A0A7K0G4F6_9SPHI|nr:transposase [Pedobacter petrophilus]MRX78697.1 transposase [Pedobacter petrophilus]
MGYKYAVTDDSGIYFITTTVVNWIDVFTRKELAEVIIESLKYCQKEKGLIIHAWCLMPSHLHMIVSMQEGKNLPDLMRDFKKFTSRKITQSIREINESRDWLLNKFSFAAKIHAKSDEFKFWQDGYHPISLETNLFIEQKLDYIHRNPVEAGFVYEPEHYVYSSAINYSGGLGLIEVVYLE